MTTTTHSHKVWTNKGGHVKAINFTQILFTQILFTQILFTQILQVTSCR
jgi:hypothetical protein